MQTKNISEFGPEYHRVKEENVLNFKSDYIPEKLWDDFDGFIIKETSDSIEEIWGTDSNETIAYRLV